MSDSKQKQTEAQRNTKTQSSHLHHPAYPYHHNQPTIVHKDRFTHRRCDTQTFLCTNTLIHRRFCTETPLHIDPFYTQTLQTLLHTDTFTYTQTPLHTRLLYTETLLYINASTHSYNFTSGFDDRTSFRAQGLRQTRQDPSLPQFLPIETPFMRKGCTGQVKITF